MEHMFLGGLRAGIGGRAAVGARLIGCAIALSLVCGLAPVARAEHNVQTSSDPNFAAVGAAGCSDEAPSDQAAATLAACHAVGGIVGAVGLR